MRLITYLSLFFLVLFFGCTDNTTEAPPKMEPESYFFGQRAYPSGKINQKAVVLAAENFLSASAAKTDEPAWVNVGPSTVGGRISAIDAHQQSDGNYTVYAGAASGGVFKSTNNGLDWAPIFDDQPVMGIGCIAISPFDNETIYVGTGEINGSGSIIYGNGLYKSTNGGLSWEHLGFEASGSIGSISFHPTDPDIMYMSVMGTLYEESDLRGIYRTTDGGDNWERILFGNDNTGGLRVIVDQQNPDRIYASLWERYRRAYDRIYFGENSGVFRSLDGGDNWTEITPIPGELGRIGIAAAPSNPDVLYASISNAGQTLEGVYKSSDGGDNWEELTLNGDLFTTGFEWWFNEVAVHPTNPDELHRVSFTVSRLNTAEPGAVWEEIFFDVHVDQHAYWMDPEDPNNIWLGNDGGVYFSEDGGENNVFRGNIPNNQAYGIHVYRENENVRLLGTQDNGTWGTIDGNVDEFEKLFGGDGFRSAFGVGENPPLYVESQRGNIFVIRNGNLSPVDVPPGQYNWNTPFIVHPTEQNTMLFGGEKVYRTTNAGGSSVEISPDLEGPNPPTGGLTFNTVYSLAMSEVDNDIIWAGMDNGRIWITENDGGNWTDVSEDLPKRWCTSIAAHPTEALTAYVTFSGFAWAEDTAHVYKTIDGGQSWTGLEANLPDVPVNKIVIDSATMDLYLGTDIGVFVSEDDGGSWEPFGQGMPAVVVRDLDLHKATRQLYAGTYGRSIFMAQLEDVISSDATVVDNEWKINIGPNPTSGPVTISGTLASSGPLQLTWYDTNGRLLNRSQSQQPAGAFRVNANAPSALSGRYVLRIEADGKLISKSVVVQ